MPDNASLGIPVVDGLLGCDCCPFESDVFGFQIVAFQFQLFYHSGERDGRYAPGRADWENARIVPKNGIRDYGKEDTYSRLLGLCNSHGLFLLFFEGLLRLL
jgi:hypothetical protein